MNMIHTIRSTLFGVMLLVTNSMTSASDLVDPYVFTSNKTHKILDLLMVAKPSRVNALKGVTGWVYEICERKYSINDSCPKDKTNPNPYGGTRLQLDPGDTLQVHLVNDLPKIPESKHRDDPGEQFLEQNPTNIHTHGMLVSPSHPDPLNISQAYGDNIFVLTFNSVNGKPEINSSTHLHGDVRTDSTDYQIVVPAHHPSGLYWFHPHAHGISLNQVSAGLSGIITVGQVNDYIPELPANVTIRHLILKDIQVNGDNTVNDQEDPSFCTSISTQAGSCNGDNGSKWYFTLNGQLNPDINVNSAGQVWRITNASGSVSYELQLTKKTNGSLPQSAMVMQILSIDGVSVTPSTTLSVSDQKEMGGAKFRPVTCPGTNFNSPKALCTTKLHMMPGTRTEVLIVNRDINGNIIDADAGKNKATLQTLGYSTGFTGDTWPAIDLAQVSFTGNHQGAHLPVLNVKDSKHDISGLNFNTIAAELATANTAVPYNSDCKALPDGWKRRIFFGIPSDGDFGLGFELVNEKGQTVPGSFQDIEAFPSAAKSICLPLSAGNTLVNEHWELINVASEDHNFHIHQTKFRVLTNEELKSKTSGKSSKSILQDSVPLLTGNDNCDGTVDNWRNGSCQTTPVAVEIPFAITGDFVFHCHILEHEDGGMMAAIRVVSSETKPHCKKNTHKECDFDKDQTH
ncbi:MAG: multicopper oxidase domain-containing protein [Methylococcales bacterium]